MKLSAHASQILEGLAQVAHSRLEEAFTVPPAIYADPEVANLELENIFKTDWLCPGLAAGCLLTFILSLGYYITPALVGGPSDNMIAGFIDSAMNSENNWGKAAALGTVLLTATLILYYVYNKLVGIDKMKLG